MLTQKATGWAATMKTPPAQKPTKEMITPAHAAGVCPWS